MRKLHEFAPLKGKGAGVTIGGYRLIPKVDELELYLRHRRP